jgi:hypothetical protein
MREREQKRQNRTQGGKNVLENGCPGKKLDKHTICNNEMHSIKVQASIFRVDGLQ